MLRLTRQLVRRLPLAALASLFVFWTLGSVGAIAQTQGTPATTATTASQTGLNGNPTKPLDNFHKFLNHHPDIARRLARNPHLIDNKKFVQGHPALNDFIKNHPGVREAVRKRPGEFMRGEQRIQHHEHQQRRHHQ